MGINEINAWIHNPERDYHEGLLIYNKYKNTNKFDNYLQSFESPSRNSMQFKMLYKRIVEIHRKLSQNPNLIKPEDITVKPIDVNALLKKKGQQDNSLKANRPIIVDNPLVEVSQLPKELQQDYMENKILTKEIGILHEEMKSLPGNEKFNAKRKIIAEKITDKDDKRAANWEKIDNWWRENMLNTDQQKKEFNEKKDELLFSLKEAKQLFNKIDNLKINISREEKRMVKNPQLKEKITLKINNWKKELTELEAKVQ